MQIKCKLLFPFLPDVSQETIIVVHIQTLAVQPSVGFSAEISFIYHHLALSGMDMGPREAVLNHLCICAFVQKREPWCDCHFDLSERDQKHKQKVIKHLHGNCIPSDESCDYSRLKELGFSPHKYNFVIFIDEVTTDIT